MGLPKKSLGTSGSTEHLFMRVWSFGQCKVIREKSRGEGSLIGQDTIENVSEPKFFF